MLWKGRWENVPSKRKTLLGHVNFKTTFHVRYSYRRVFLFWKIIFQNLRWSNVFCNRNELGETVLDEEKFLKVLENRRFRFSFGLDQNLIFLTKFCCFEFFELLLRLFFNRMFAFLTNFLNFSELSIIFYKFFLIFSNFSRKSSFFWLKFCFVFKFWTVFVKFSALLELQTKFRFWNQILWAKIIHRIC